MNLYAVIQEDTDTQFYRKHLVAHMGISPFGLIPAFFHRPVVKRGKAKCDLEFSEGIIVRVGAYNN